MKNKGFTLIELLVVIAIIGIISSIALASLVFVRQRARDGAIKTNLNTVRAEMELYYVGRESYGTPSTDACDEGDQPFVGVNNIRNAIASAELNSSSNATCLIGSNGSSWAVSVPLATNVGVSWCVNDVGQSGEGQATGGGAQPATCS